jgi:hypothetical protein
MTALRGVSRAGNASVRPVVPTCRARHPRAVDVMIEERLVDLVGEGYDAGVRLTEAIERDMVQMAECASRILAHPPPRTCAA